MKALPDPNLKNLTFLKALSGKARAKSGDGSKRFFFSSPKNRPGLKTIIFFKLGYTSGSKYSLSLISIILDKSK